MSGREGLVDIEQIAADAAYDYHLDRCEGCGNYVNGPKKSGQLYEVILAALRRAAPPADGEDRYVAGWRECREAAEKAVEAALNPNNEGNPDTALLKRETAATPFSTRWGYENAFQILNPIRYLLASNTDPDGIVRR